MIRVCLYESFASDFILARAKVKSIVRYLKHEISTLTEDDLFDLRIVYNELIINAITHGNKQDITKKVELFIEMGDGVIKSIIRDEGDGFDYSKIFAGQIMPRQNALCEHGRGLILVASLVDCFEWNRQGNEIRFHKAYKVK